jgi:hypothetical protein
VSFISVLHATHFFISDVTKKPISVFVKRKYFDIKPTATYCGFWKAINKLREDIEMCEFATADAELFKVEMFVNLHLYIFLYSLFMAR